MKKYFSSPAIIMNYVLGSSLIVLIIAAGAAIYYGQTRLSDFARSANHVKIDTEVNELNILQAKKLENAMKEQRENAARAAAVVADSKYYTYQNQIVNDLNNYARIANITILGFNFSTNTTANKQKVAAGPKTVTATISLKSPMPYDDYFHFLQLIENNLTKMQVSELTIQSELRNSGMIAASSIQVEVYVQ